MQGGLSADVGVGLRAPCVLVDHSTQRPAAHPVDGGARAGKLGRCSLNHVTLISRLENFSMGCDGSKESRDSGPRDVAGTDVTAGRPPAALPQADKFFIHGPPIPFFFLTLSNSYLQPDSRPTSAREEAPDTNTARGAREPLLGSPRAAPFTDRNSDASLLQMRVLALPVLGKWRYDSLLRLSRMRSQGRGAEGGKAEGGGGEGSVGDCKPVGCMADNAVWDLQR